MKSNPAVATGPAALLLCLIAACAPSASTKQSQIPAPPTDWSGQWEVVGLTTGASGNFEESEQELRKSFGETPPPYRPEWVKTLATDAAFAQFMQGADAIVTCSFGFPSLMLESPLMFEILVTPKETAMIFSGRESRHIYTDGRSHTPADQLWPTYWGESVGHWDEQTLVVDTVSVSQESIPNNWVVISVWGLGFFEPVAVLSGQAHYSERIRMVNKDLLEDQLMIDDPQALSAPWQMTHQYKRVTSVNRLVHEDCRGNDRNPVVNGKFTLKAP